MIIVLALWPKDNSPWQTFFLWGQYTYLQQEQAENNLQPECANIRHRFEAYCAGDFLESALMFKCK